jgi:hypothetical protein
VSEQPTKQQIKKWTRALRSGKYRQCKSVLQSERGFCCLGVACTVFAPDYLKDYETGLLKGALPQTRYGAPQWLANMNADFYDQTTACLPLLNDTTGLSFDEIADCLEAVYIHEVLNG